VKSWRGHSEQNRRWRRLQRKTRATPPHATSFHGREHSFFPIRWREWRGHLAASAGGIAVTRDCILVAAVTSTGRCPYTAGYRHRRTNLQVGGAVEGWDSIMASSLTLGVFCRCHHLPTSPAARMATCSWNRRQCLTPAGQLQAGTWGSMPTTLPGSVRMVFLPPPPCHTPHFWRARTRRQTYRHACLYHSPISTFAVPFSPRSTGLFSVPPHTTYLTYACTTITYLPYLQDTASLGPQGVGLAEGGFFGWKAVGASPSTSATAMPCLPRHRLTSGVRFSGKTPLYRYTWLTVGMQVVWALTACHHYPIPAFLPPPVPSSSLLCPSISSSITITLRHTLLLHVHRTARHCSILYSPLPSPMLVERHHLGILVGHASSTIPTSLSCLLGGWDLFFLFSSSLSLHSRAILAYAMAPLAHGSIHLLGGAGN